MIEIIVRLSILIILRSEVPTTTHLGPPNPTGETFEALDKESQAVSQWIVTINNDLVPEDIDNDPFSGFYRWVGVKVKSSKRNMSDENNFDQIGRVIEALRANFRIRLPSTTSLFIHVGELWRNEEVWNSGPRSLRAFYTVWWFLERYVTELAHLSRRTHEQCLLLREYSRLARDPKISMVKEDEMQRVIPALPSDVVQSFWKAKDTATIYQKLSMPMSKYRSQVEGKGSIGFAGYCRNRLEHVITSHNNGHTGTLEFRSMKGTLDPLLIVNWLAVVTRLYDFARRGNTADIQVILQKVYLGGDNYSGVQLFYDIQLVFLRKPSTSMRRLKGIMWKKIWSISFPFTKRIFMAGRRSRWNFGLIAISANCSY